MSKYLFTQWLGNNLEEIESFIGLHSPKTFPKVERREKCLMLPDEAGLGLPIQVGNFVAKHESQNYIVVYGGYTKDELINYLETLWLIN